MGAQVRGPRLRNQVWGLERAATRTGVIGQTELQNVSVIMGALTGVAKRHKYFDGREGPMFYCLPAPVPDTPIAPAPDADMEAEPVRRSTRPNLGIPPPCYRL